MTQRFESPSKRFSVFDFDEDDVVEVESAKSNAKFRKPRASIPSNKNKKKKKNKSPITKYTFLQCFSKGAKTPLKEISNVTIEVDALGSSNHQTKQVHKIPDDEERIHIMCSSTTLISSPSKNEATLEEQASEPGSCGYDNVETALSNLRLESKNSRRAGKRNKKSGLKQLRCAVYDPHWSKRQEENKSLDSRYGDTWNFNFDSDKPFEDVIYPKGDPDAVTISKRDLELLEPETFINDTIIDFYILYLKSNIQPEEKHRFHFFNSFFFRKLADLEKDPSSSCERKAAFQRVRKWTRKVNLFEKDYIFIPVNHRLHWSLIVICHPGEVANCEGEGIESLPRVPCILHMDSIKGSHRDLKNLVQRYLCEEWKERHGDTAEGDSLRFLQLRFLELELPQQENLSDCGLFLLHYVERFLAEAPVNFSPFKITELSNFLKKKWFPPAEASLKRHQIKKLLYDILDQSRETLIADCINLDESPQVLKNTDNEEPGIKHFYKMSNSTQKIHGNCYSSEAHGIRITSPGAYSSPSHVCCSRERGRVADKNYLPLIANNMTSFMSPIQEVGDAEEMTDSPVDIEACPKDTALPSDIPPRDTSQNHGFSKNIGDNADVNSISDTSGSGSEIFSVVGIDEDDSLVEAEAFNCPRKTEKSESSSSGDLTACVVQDSEEESDMHGTEVICISSSRANQQFFHQQADSTGNNNHKEINMLSSSEDQASDSDERQTPKRPRLTHPVGRRRHTRSLMRALHL
ncbi:putative Ulp1 peptidase [Rosa chinensis]|uniref:Putative Ulp1 peptidase n=1 Tax=Rosa chinensis TaxID=74649 RepID=A0A2P6PQW8_ROSCH|nr:probable ubiquitin-like-specific protease 2B isoform X1 [Rosa chinensis]PRQ24312.1 putative Ulp1 peptidase [Rosa chinensis]